MIVIADSNIIISALYNSKGLIANILKNERNLQFIAPDFVFDEIKNHLDEIAAALNINKPKLIEEIKVLTANVKFENTEHIPKEFIQKAISIVGDIDIDDTFFVALHFYKKHKIWTGDKILIKGLIKKGFDICISTKEIKLKLYKK